MLEQNWKGETVDEEPTEIKQIELIEGESNLKMEVEMKENDIME